MRAPKRPVGHYLRLIPGENARRASAFLEAERQRFEAAPGSSRKHQAWAGGYLDHVEETMWLAENFYLEMSEARPLPFSLGDAILVLFLHDLEKPWKYLPPTDDFPDDAAEHRFVERQAAAFGIELSDDHRNALRYVHGEGDDYDPVARVQGPLAAFCHTCDTLSARVWHDEPRPASSR